MRKDQFCEWCRVAVDRQQLDWFGHHVEVGGELIHYVEQGQGFPVLLIHGLLAWSYTWRPNLGEISQVSRAIALDLRGFGLSEKSGARRHSLDDQVEVIRGFMDALGLDQAVLCGHSMGGEISLRLALRYPERVRALVLVSSSAYLTWSKRPLERVALGVPGISHLFARAVVLNRRFATGTLRAAVRAPERIGETEVAAYLLPARTPGATSALVAILRDLDFGATSGRIREVEHKSLIVWGENDPWVPAHLGKRLADELPHSRLVMIPECGHVPQEEHPQRFNEAVLDFLEEVLPF